MSQTSPPTGQPGRYNRSFGGLVGSMIVLVVAVTIAWLALGAFRDDAEFEPLPIDYDASVEALVDNGAVLAYPEEVPAGWRVNNLAYDPDGPTFSLALLTDEERFAGVFHGTGQVDDVLATYVDENPAEGDPVELVDGESVLSTWQVFTDEGGDTAYVRVRDGAEADDDPLVTMVYGSASPDDLVGLVEMLLTTESTTG